MCGPNHYITKLSTRVFFISKASGFSILIFITGGRGLFGVGGTVGAFFSAVKSLLAMLFNWNRYRLTGLGGCASWSLLSSLARCLRFLFRCGRNS